MSYLASENGQETQCFIRVFRLRHWRPSFLFLYFVPKPAPRGGTHPSLRCPGLGGPPLPVPRPKSVTNISASTVFLANHLTLNYNNSSRVLKNSVFYWYYKGFLFEYTCGCVEYPRAGGIKKVCFHIGFQRFRLNTPAGGI